LCRAARERPCCPENRFPKWHDPCIVSPMDRKPFPYWRMVQGTDDGCTVYQCLACKADWESRTSPCGWRFCPHCGEEWLGEHECVEHGWKVHALCERHGREMPSAVYPQWVVQERTLGDDGKVVSDWHNDIYPMNHREQALAYMREQEAENSGENWLSLRDEYRIVRWYPSQTRYGEGRALPLGEKPGEALRWLAGECERADYGRRHVGLRCEPFRPRRPLAVYSISADGVKRIDAGE